MTRRNMPDINPNGARYTVRVEAKPRHNWHHLPDHHGTLSTAWRQVMKIADAYRAAGFDVSYSERWTDDRWYAQTPTPEQLAEDHQRLRPMSATEDDEDTRRSFRVADIVCTPPENKS
jgi:hypothetical protein